MPIGSTTTDDLAAALSVVVHTGLPIEDGAAPELLLDLRSVFARSVVPSDSRSRLAAVNELLPRLIAGMADATYREGVQILFGLAPGTRGTTLTARRRQAAQVLGYNATYLRTGIEPKLVRAVASTLHDDLLRYASRAQRASESEEPTGDTPSLGPEHINQEEELISRIWKHVYGLRAEIIATLRLSEVEGMEEQAEEHRQAALREEVALKRVAAEYATTYGSQLVPHGDTEYTLEALHRLVSWSMREPSPGRPPLRDT